MAQLEGIIGYFNYVLFREDGVTPFYAGLSKHASRIDQHVRISAKRRNYKERIITKVVAALGYVPYVITANGLSKEDAVRCEKGIIAFYGRHPNGPLVNATDGGDGVVGQTFSEEMLAKMSASAKLRAFSEEHKANISKGKMGHVQSAETRAKISATKQERGPSAKHLAAFAAQRGKKAPASTGRAIANALRRKKKSPEHIAAVQAALRASLKWAAYNERRNPRKGCAALPVAVK